MMELGCRPLTMSCQYTRRCVSFSFSPRPRCFRLTFLAKSSPFFPAEATVMARRRICAARMRLMNFAMLALCGGCGFFVFMCC
ncbi:hypothetical protein CARUB_v10028685mg [Capsella rubella]|uniref:Transmembrane protein n=1 Tax=Capsella rubella TaxID=81985 RepID=R0GEV3_9BRAS|nr:hypothetical protein CARUB_v10028685mg [Capsella rubella]